METAQQPTDDKRVAEMSYVEFRARLSLEITKSRTDTEWMKSVGYRPEDKDMGLRRWCELTGTTLEAAIASMTVKAPPTQPELI